LAHQGFVVVVNGRKESADSIETLRQVREISPESSFLAFDVSDRRQVKDSLELELEQRGPFWGAVLNAGIHQDTPFPGMSEEQWDQVLNTDLGGFFNVLRPLIMPMIKLRDKGRIVVISSISGLVGNRGQVNYSAAKAGLIGATRSLSKELASRGITVNCVAPGGVETEMLKDEIREQLVKAVPMGRLATPEEVAGSVSFLFADEAGYMTGQTLVLNGGMF
jgi:3-oxoacyl-[acyl-carrier protein] reductase